METFCETQEMNENDYEEEEEEQNDRRNLGIFDGAEEVLRFFIYYVNNCTNTFDKNLFKISNHFSNNIHGLIIYKMF